MIRILILLIALNTILPIAGFASVCASNMSAASASLSDVPSSLHEQHTSVSTSSPSHCNDPDMPCHDKGSVDCDSGCCVSCFGGFVTLLTLSVNLLFPVAPIKPASGYINFSTRSISPELQPPLI